MVLRNWSTTPGGDKRCRACNTFDERMSHLPQCSQIGEVFTKFHALALQCIEIGPLDEPLSMLGWYGNGFLPSALSVLHIILWKFVIIALTRIELQGEKWDTKAIWKQALYRTRTRILSHSEGVRRWAVARWSKGQGIPEAVLQLSLIHI